MTGPQHLQQTTHIHTHCLPASKALRRQVGNIGFDTWRLALAVQGHTPGHDSTQQQGCKLPTPGCPTLSAGWPTHVAAPAPPLPPHPAPNPPTPARIPPILVQPNTCGRYSHRHAHTTPGTASLAGPPLKHGRWVCAAAAATTLPDATHMWVGACGGSHRLMHSSRHAHPPQAATACHQQQPKQAKGVLP